MLSKLAIATNTINQSNNTIKGTNMSDKQPIQIRTRKFIRNALLARKQFVRLVDSHSQLLAHWSSFSFYFVLQLVDVIHPGRANVSRSELQEKLAQVLHPLPLAYFCLAYRLWFGLLVIQNQRSWQSLRLWIPHCLRWWKLLWICFNIRFCWSCQEIRTKIQIS